MFQYSKLHAISRKTTTINFIPFGQRTNNTFQVTLNHSAQIHFNNLLPKLWSRNDGGGDDYYDYYDNALWMAALADAAAAVMGKKHFGSIKNLPPQMYTRSLTTVRAATKALAKTINERSVPPCVHQCFCSSVLRPSGSIPQLHITRGGPTWCEISSVLLPVGRKPNVGTTSTHRRHTTRHTPHKVPLGWERNAFFLHWQPTRLGALYLLNVWRCLLGGSSSVAYNSRDDVYALLMRTRHSCLCFNGLVYVVSDPIIHVAHWSGEGIGAFKVCTAQIRTGRSWEGNPLFHGNQKEDA